jgi:hypothetical protein
MLPYLVLDVRVTLLEDLVVEVVVDEDDEEPP